jgi:hypothetical protein
MQIVKFDEKDFSPNDYALIPCGINLWKLSCDVSVVINMPAGKGYKFLIKKGFVTNLRSGSDLLNPWIPRMGDKDMTLAYILHDALYTWNECGDHFLQKNVADDLLKAMLIECDKNTEKKMAAAANKEARKQCKEEYLGWFKIRAIHLALKVAGGPAYRERNPPPYDTNNDKVAMEVLV